MNNPTTVVGREEWGARRAKATEKVENPVNTIVMTWSGTKTCKNKTDCMKRIRKLQKRHMKEEGQPDIKYNFLVGGDGQVYEGRGWDVSTKVSAVGNESNGDLDGKSVIIALIGPKDSTPTNPMLLALAGISGVGLGQRYVSSNVKIVKLSGETMESYNWDLDKIQKPQKQKSKVTV